MSSAHQFDRVLAEEAAHPALMDLAIALRADGRLVGAAYVTAIIETDLAEAAAMARKKPDSGYDRIIQLGREHAALVVEMLHDDQTARARAAQLLQAPTSQIDDLVHRRAGLHPIVWTQLFNALTRT